MGLTKFEAAALLVLAWSSEGLYGSDFVAKMPTFWFVRDRIYTALERLVESGLVSETEEPPVIPGSKLHRTRHHITEAGLRAIGFV